MVFTDGWENILFPDFGKAGMPYAKSCRSAKALHGAKTDPGLLFDCGYMDHGMTVVG